MASAASLLTPHMLTEAYTSLLAALTVWNPAERRTDTSDGDRQAGDTYRAFPTGTFGCVESDRAFASPLLKRGEFGLVVPKMAHLRNRALVAPGCLAVIVQGSTVASSSGSIWSTCLRFSSSKQQSPSKISQRQPDKSIMISTHLCTAVAMESARQLQTRPSSFLRHTFRLAGSLE